ncbi:PAS domain S-box protein [Flavobacterium sp.]|uniref:PAS domain S-box protein n=1 Tax=Flavobacterium sp. TaxID=239 RepID=UPI003426561F
MTEQKNKELENELLALISINFNEENELINASKKLCKSISEFGKFDWVEVWIPNLEKSHMQLFSQYVAAPEDEKFYDYSSDLTTIPIDEGLAGKVWAQQEQILCPDIQNYNDFVRKNAAKKIGLIAVLGIPIISDGDVIGVLKIGTKQSGNYLNNYTQLFKNIEGFIGSEFNRKKLENDLTQLFDTIPDILCLLDFEGRFLKINNAGCKLLRYTEEEILYHSFDQFIHPDDKNISFSEVLQSQHGENTSQFENRYLTKDGEIIWLSWYCNPSFEEGLIYATAKNITEEKKLRELNKQAGALAKIGSWEVDLINATNYWSEITHQLHETDPKSFFPDLAESLKFYRDDFRPMINAMIEKSSTTGEAIDFEAVLVTANNKERWVRVIGNAEIVEGHCKRIYGSFQDIHERKEAENRLAESENRFRTILEAEPECIKLLDSTGEVLMMNPAGLAMIGADTKKQVIGKSVLGILLPEHRAAFSELTKKVFNDEPGKLVFEIEGFKGTRRWLETHAVPLKNEQGKIISLLGVTRDITERKIAEEKLVHSEQKYRLLALELQLQQLHLTNAQQVAKIGSWETNLSDLKLTWSDETYRIFGTDIKSFEPTHEKFLNLVHPLDRDSVDKAFADSTKSTNHSQNLIEHRIVTADGVVKVVEERWKITYNDNGEPMLALGICQDVTERKKAEESILQSNERFEKVTEATNDVIWDWDIENKTYYRSKAIKRFFGKKYSGVFPDTDLWSTEHFHSEDLIKIKDSFFEAIENPATTRWELEYRVINKQGKTIYVIDRAIIIRNKQAKAIRVVGAMTDISEQKQMTVQLSELNQLLQQHTFELQRSNQELEQFAFVASHDLQEPLRMVSSFMELLKRKYGDVIDEKGHQYIHFATDGAKRMKQIILDLLDYSRAGKSTDGKEEVEMSEVLSEFKQLRRKLILEKKAIITSKELPTLNTYKAAITQILHCLLDNALKYAKEDTPPIVDIVVAENKKEWKFSIKDNGIGINPQFFSKIFIIFQRLHNKDDYPGTGIGLSIAKRQVEFLGGQIWLDSTVGEGTTFYFTIPKTT